MSQLAWCGFVEEFLVAEDIPVTPVIDKGRISFNTREGLSCTLRRILANLSNDVVPTSVVAWSNALLSQYTTLPMTKRSWFESFSEFLLGEDILVAPVLEEGATSRDIYLPQGLWRDNMHPDRDLIQGRTWLRDYPVALDQLPFFTMIRDTL
uniref:Glycosyl hydrolase family 31 C-terminal domain-containing protein n=1 Tax=Timema douglasi TaxID=61478 RepID=A0A7R8VA99_TIMDO|nr:unnamed protein product [Timema douglasi]